MFEGRNILTNQSSLSATFPQNPALRHAVMSMITLVATEQFQSRVTRFRANLTPFNQEIFDECQKVPYASKDWWRDPHDIVVTQSLQTIIRRENMSGRMNLPDWLVTAAILHDRGYGILAKDQGAKTDSYLKTVGAHWENPDTRILHSLLSRQFAEDLLLKESGKMFAHRALISEADLFLQVIETHDHPLIGKFEELPEVGRHHFDADSLFSISLLSFIKDYLSYLGDPAKLEKTERLGIAEAGKFVPDDLLKVRIARYYPESQDLPVGWNTIRFPLHSEFAGFSEAGKCLVPSSETARMLTNGYFQDLADCCQVLSKIQNLIEFEDWLRNKVSQQFNKLQILAEKPVITLELLLP